MFVALLLLKFSNVIFGNISSKPKYYFDNILFKTQVLLLVIFLQKPKYYFSNILHTHTHTQKKKKKKNQYYFGSILQKSNTILTTFYQKSKTINFWANNYSMKVQILFSKNIILCLKSKFNNLWQKFWHIKFPSKYTNSWENINNLWHIIYLIKLFILQNLCEYYPREITITLLQ